MLRPRANCVSFFLGGKQYLQVPFKEYEYLHEYLYITWVLLHLHMKYHLFQIWVVGVQDYALHALNHHYLLILGICKPVGKEKEFHASSCGAKTS